MLLSRTAEHLYRFGRHLERSEAIARVVREHTNLLVDLPVSIDSDWSCLLAVVGTGDHYRERYDSTHERDIVSYLMADIGNPASVVRTVAAARENLRNARQTLPRSTWEAVSRLHSVVSTNAGGSVQRTTRLDLVDEIIACNQHVIGLLETTMSHDDAFMMISLGRQVERGDMTTRVLDIRAVGLMRDGTPADLPAADRSPYEEVRWTGVLRSLGAQHMYTRTVAGPTDARSVVGFLVDDDGFPRSIAHCVRRCEQALSALPARRRVDDAIAHIRAVVAQRPVTPVPAELHHWIDRCQDALAALHDRIGEEYFTPATTAAHPASRATRPTPTPATGASAR